MLFYVGWRYTVLIVISSLLVICVYMGRLVKSNSDKYVLVPLPPGVQCDHYFIDLGANNGVSVLDFLFPSVAHKLSSGKLVRVVLEKGWSDKRFCVIGFEANARFTEELLELQDKLRMDGHHVTFYTNTAASTADGSVKIMIDDNDAAVSSSLMLSKLIYPSGETDSDKYHTGFTDGIDFAKFLTKNMNTESTVVIKMDIEGAEYTLLRHMLSTGVFCHRDGTTGNLLIDHLLLEFHGDRLNMAKELPILYDDKWTSDVEGLSATRQAQVLNDVLVWMIRECGVEVMFDTD